MKNKKLLLALLAVIMVLSVSIGSALAFFSTYTVAGGSKTISLLPKTTIDEPTANDEHKLVVITNSGNAPCFVRVKAFAGGGVTTETGPDTGSGWSYDSAGGYWNYDTALMPGEATTQLEIKLNDLPVSPEEGDSFHIAVVYESTPAIFADGSYAADWTRDVTTIDSEENGGQG